MKKLNYEKNNIFLLLILFNSFCFGQILGSENFDTLTLGNIGTDINGATAGQGGFFIASSNGSAPTTTSNESASNLQIISNEFNSTQGAQITTPNGDNGTTILTDIVDADWAGRTSGNNIFEVEFSFFTSSTTTSRAGLLNLFVSDEGGTEVHVGGVQFDSQTRELNALARLNNMESVGVFGINLGASNTGLILDINTWYRIGYSYDTSNG